MPTYELTCDECGNRFERFLTRILRTDDKVCPRCGSSRVNEGVGGGYVARATFREGSGGCAPRGGFG